MTRDHPIRQAIRDQLAAGPLPAGFLPRTAERFGVTMSTVHYHLLTVRALFPAAPADDRKTERPKD